MSEWFAQGMPIESIPVDDRAALYGDGLFETVAIRFGRPRLWTLHFDRLRAGCDRLGLTTPQEPALQLELESAIRSSKVDTRYAVAKIIVSAGGERRGYQRSDQVSPSVRIGIFESQPLARAKYRDGVAVRLCRTRLALQPALAGIKSLNRLEQVLARAEWNDSSVAEGLMLDTDDRLICGTMSNVFICRENSIATPAVTRCGVLGVMRQHVLSILSEAGQACEVRDITVDELRSADEVFLTNSQFGVLPVRRLDSTDFAVGEVTRDIMEMVARNGVAEGAQ